MAEIESYSPEYVAELENLLQRSHEQVDRILTNWEETLELLRYRQDEVALLRADLEFYQPRAVLRAGELPPSLTKEE